jgi:hypothetical protein
MLSGRINRALTRFFADLYLNLEEKTDHEHSPVLTIAEEMIMKKTKLIDMFGLSGDPSDDDELDDLFFRLEHEAPKALKENSATACRFSIATVPHLKPKRLFPIPKSEKRSMGSIKWVSRLSYLSNQPGCGVRK